MSFKFANKIQKMTSDFLDQVVGSRKAGSSHGPEWIHWDNWYFPDHVFHWKPAVAVYEVIINTVEGLLK